MNGTFAQKLKEFTELTATAKNNTERIAELKKELQGECNHEIIKEMNPFRRICELCLLEELGPIKILAKPFILRSESQVALLPIGELLSWLHVLDQRLSKRGFTECLIQKKRGPK